MLRGGLVGAGCSVIAGCAIRGSDDEAGDEQPDETRADGSRSHDEPGGANDGPPSSDTPIETHRKGPLSLAVRRPDGTPLRDATVSVNMLEHAFSFGTGVDARYLVEDASPGGPYRERLRELFNTAVVEHRNKWRPWENESEREYAIEATSWLRKHGFALRGHTAIWQRLGQPVVPKDVVEKVRSDDDDRAEYVARRCREHVSDVVGHYAGRVAEWDVVNEQLRAHQLTDVVNPDAPPPRAPELLRWFERAREADPKATLYLNEYDVLAGDYPDQRDAYETLANFLLENGVDLGGLGMQAHFKGPGEVRSPAAVRTTLDRFAELGVELQVTEYDTHGENWSEESAAEHLRTFLRNVFAHPSVVGFVMWGFWDGAHWADQAPLFRRDWSPKPAYDVYRSLVFDEWWTDKSGRTDDDGVFRTDVFLGEHKVTVMLGEHAETYRVVVTDPSATTRVPILFSPN